MTTEEKVFDPEKKYVRITGTREHGLIEFDFAIGEPEIYIELILPFAAFEEFCSHNNVSHLTAEEAARVDYDRLKWRYGKPGIEK
jgi:phenol hydroxylase P0 protein